MNAMTDSAFLKAYSARGLRYAYTLLNDLFRRKPTFLQRHWNVVIWSPAAGIPEGEKWAFSAIFDLIVECRLTPNADDRA